MRALPRALLPCAALLLATGCGDIADTLFIVEVETEQICKVQRAITFPASQRGTTSFSYAFELPLGQVGAELPDGRLESELRLRKFELVVTSGNANMNALDSARVSLRRPGSAEIIRTLVEYQRPSQGSAPERLTLYGVDPVDVPQLARESSVELLFEASGTLPEQAWTVDIEACAGLWARVHYFDLLF
jgi:hypothetical protein